jgi:hypothetical protein
MNAGSCEDPSPPPPKCAGKCGASRGWVNSGESHPPGADGWFKVKSGQACGFSQFRGTIPIPWLDWIHAEHLREQVGS